MWFALVFATVTGCCLLHGAQSARWISTIHDGDELFLCVGANITLPWQYELSPGDVISDVQWLYNGESDELIAMVGHGHFLPMPAFAGTRVEQLTNAGIVVNTAAVSDTGNYTVEVQGYDTSGFHFILHQTVVVHISDDLMIQGGELHVQQTSEAVLNQATDQWSIQLTCGFFDFHDSPPFYVEWTTPDGTTHNSTDFNNGNFHLLLDNPVKGGNYTCRIPFHHLADACVHGNAAHQGEATLFVDKVDARLTLLEKENEQLKQENSVLKNSMDTRISQLQTVDQQLQTKIEQLKDENSFLKNRSDVSISQLQMENQRLRNEDKLLKNSTDAMFSRLQTADQQLQTEYEQLAQRTEGIETAASRQVSFHAVHLLDTHPALDTPLIFRDVVTNQGNAYDDTTGYFTAPYPGTYFFIATSGSYDDDRYAGFNLHVGSAHVADSFAYNYNGQSTLSTLGAVVHLFAGQRVWVISLGDGYHPASTFSGFLFSPDS